MSLASLSFIIFLIIILIFYYLIPQKLKWMILLVASIFFLFYNNFEYVYLIYILIILLASYIGGILIDKYQGTKYALISCLISVLVITLQLAFLKYTNLFGNIISDICNLFGDNYKYQEIHRSSPIGISYYTLIMIGYLVSVYRKEVNPQKNVLKCALFMTYFPQLTSGPFNRYKDIKDDLYGNHKFNLKIIKNGFIRILWGLFKILVISSRLGIFVDNVYGNLDVLNGFYIVIAGGFYTLQLYTNFSGSIDIVMGASECLGIKMPENFRNPFFSKSITEFWRRWHITLGSWLKDYIFYPLLKSNFIQNITTKTKKVFGKKWGKKIPMYLSMFILWLLIGIWHGGAYHYILASGILQFLFIVCEDITEPFFKKLISRLKINPNWVIYKLFQCIKTFLLFSFSMVFFRASSVIDGTNIIKAAINGKFNFTHLTLSGLNFADYLILVITLVILFSVELIQRKGSVREKLEKQHFILRWSLIYILILMIIVLGIYGIGFDVSEFIYGKF